MSPGYSVTPLIKKLGIQPQMKILLVDAPTNYVQWLEQDLSRQLVSRPGDADLVHVFASSQRQFDKSMGKLEPSWQANPQLIVWVSWYKKSAQIPTDLTEDDIRSYALQHNLVDIKVCAVSEQWSGLKLVVPLAKRKPKSRTL
jgi:hypothetical protein